MNNWIAAWLAEEIESRKVYTVSMRVFTTWNGIDEYTKRLNQTQARLVARQERDYARARIAELRAYWRQDQDLLSALTFELGKIQRELAEVQAERDEALSRLGAIRLGAMEG